MKLSGQYKMASINSDRRKFLLGEGSNYQN